MRKRKYSTRQQTSDDFKRRTIARRATRAGITIFILLAIVTLDRLGVFAHPITPDREKYHEKTFFVSNTVDGDTIDLDIPDDIARQPYTRIRLWGVDTPETVKPDTPVQHFGKQASDFTKRSCLNKSVRVELVAGDTRDKYKRLLAYIYLPDGKLLNAEIVAQGFGYADPRFDHPRKNEFQQLQKIAKSEKLGLWKNLKTSDLPYYLQR